MKKYLYALLAVAATLSFASCNEDIKEENGSESPSLANKTIAFSLKNSSLDTRSETGAPALKQGATISLGDPIDGQYVYLEETIGSLDDIYFAGPETKGTPVYTENFSEMSGGSFKGIGFPVATLTNATTSTFMPEGDFTDDGTYWKRDFDNWGTNDAMLFFAKMLPGGTTAASGFNYNYSATAGQSMSFTYTSPLTATAQQDIVFAGRTLTKAEAESPFPILFQHALTGVKFATAHKNDGDVKTYIKKVEFTGLYGYGTCVYTPTSENGNYVDQPTNYSSKNAFSWTLSAAGNNLLTTVYSQQFADASVNYTTGSFSSKGDYPTSFSSAGNTYNLNDGDATMTFFFPPQAMSDAVKLKVTFEIQIGNKRTEYTRDINFGSLLKSGDTFISWNAGEIRTYTLKAEEIDVDIKDKVSKYEKTDVEITNTGNIDAYIRAYIVANWYGTGDNGENGIAAGYSNAEHTAFVPAWQRNGTTGDNFGGVFTGLPGNGWVLKSDGFFYFTQKVAPGETISPTLFTKYSLNLTQHPVPHIWYISSSNGYKEFTNVRLVMEIPVQAVEAKNYTWQQAWEAAGVTFSN
jgi:hypothetical protein